MNVAAIKQLVDFYDMDTLVKAEQDLLNETPLYIDVPGADDGEKLTHILAAIFCKREMEKDNLNINQALRLYSQRVRGSLD